MHAQPVSASCACSVAPSTAPACCAHPHMAACTWQILVDSMHTANSAAWSKRRHWTAPSDVHPGCACSGYANDHGFGSFCYGWEYEAQTPWYARGFFWWHAEYYLLLMRPPGTAPLMAVSTHHPQRCNAEWHAALCAPMDAGATSPTAARRKRRAGRSAGSMPIARGSTSQQETPTSRVHLIGSMPMAPIRTLPPTNMKGACKLPSRLRPRPHLRGGSCQLACRSPSGISSARRPPSLACPHLAAHSRTSPRTHAIRRPPRACYALPCARCW